MMKDIFSCPLKNNMRGIDLKKYFKELKEEAIDVIATPDHHLRDYMHGVLDTLNDLKSIYLDLENCPD